MHSMLPFYLLGTFYLRNWSIILNLRAFKKIHVNTSYNSSNCLIVVCGEEDGIIKIRLISVCPKGSTNWVFDRPYHIALYILVFDKTKKNFKNLFSTLLLHTCPSKVVWSLCHRMLSRGWQTCIMTGSSSDQHCVRAGSTQRSISEE